MIPQRYLKKDAWPHIYTPISEDWFEDGKRYHIMQCRHCKLKYIYGKEERPIGECPLRTDKSEYGRLFR